MVRVSGVRSSSWFVVAALSALVPSPARAQGQPEAAPAPPRSPAVTPPTVATHVDAVYPAAALRERKHGDVVLAVTVDADGHVSKVDVLSSGGPDLDEAAIVAARQWTFVPAMRGERPVASRIRVPFHFAPPAPPPELLEPPPRSEPETEVSSAVQPAAPSASEPSIVVVEGRPVPPSRGASDLNLDVGEVRRVPRQNATDYLKLAPGIVLANEGGEGHAEQVFVRGFDAREGQDLEFSVGGVPINESGNLHGNGYADTHFIIPELVESLRVVEGPFDPRQGNYAVAGSADYHLGLEQRGVTGKVTTGSFGTNRLLLTWGPRGESTHTFAGAEMYGTDGFGQNRDASRATAMGQYEGRLGDHGSYRLAATAYSTHYHSAGVVRQDDVDSGRMGFYDSYSRTSFAGERVLPGGDSSRYSLAADVETRSGDARFTEQVFVIQRDLRVVENFTGFLLDAQEPGQSAHAQRGDLLDVNVRELTVGSRGAGALETTLLGRRQSLEVGYFARGDRVEGTQQRIGAATGVPYLTETELASELGEIGLYADASLRPLSFLTVRGGVRGNLFSYHVDRRQPSPDQSASAAATALLPRASLILGPYRHFSFDASYGQGVQSVDPGSITQDDRALFARVSAYEGGVSYANDAPGATITARSIFFQSHVDRDLVFDETEGRNVLGPGTRRTGWVGAARVTGAHFDQSANVTVVRSTYDDTHLVVPYAPNLVVRSDSAVLSDLPVSLQGVPLRGAVALGVSGVGPRPLPFGLESEAVVTLDASASLSWKAFELTLSATNLLDSRYRMSEYVYASNFRGPSSPPAAPDPVRHFVAGAPRAVFASLSVNLGGGG